MKEQKNEKDCHVHNGHNIDVATKPLKSKDLSEASITNAILEMQSTYEEKIKNAELISAKIKEENGVEEAVRLIEKVMEI